MAKQKITFLSNDNTEFDTEAGADAHNAFLDNEGVIEAYIDFADLRKAQAGLMRRHLSGFQAFLNNPELQVLIDAAVVRVEAEKVAAAEAAIAEKAAAKVISDATKAAAKAAESAAAKVEKHTAKTEKHAVA